MDPPRAFARHKELVRFAAMTCPEVPSRVRPAARASSREKGRRFSSGGIRGLGATSPSVAHGYRRANPACKGALGAKRTDPPRGISALCAKGTYQAIT